MDPVDLIWLTGASLVAGTVYGFAGFGAALIFMPLAAMIVEPAIAIAALSVSAISSLVTVVPSAWRACDRRAVLTMLGAAIVGLPFGVWLLTLMDVTTLRWAVSIIAILTLAALVSGWRYRGTPGLPAWLGVGAAVGVMGGSTGLNGPAMILFQLGGRDQVGRSRANTIVVLTLSGIAYLPVLVIGGVLGWPGVLAGATQIVPYGLGTLIGGRLFNPGNERLYRAVAYGIIAVAAVAGLPIRGG